MTKMTFKEKKMKNKTWMTVQWWLSSTTMKLTFTEVSKISWAMAMNLNSKKTNKSMETKSNTNMMVKKWWTLMFTILKNNKWCKCISNNSNRDNLSKRDKDLQLVSHQLLQRLEEGLAQDQLLVLKTEKWSDLKFKVSILLLMKTLTSLEHLKVERDFRASRDLKQQKLKQRVDLKSLEQAPDQSVRLHLREWSQETKL